MHALPKTGKRLRLLTSVHLHMGPNMEIGNLCSAVSTWISRDAAPSFHTTTGPFSCIPGMPFWGWGRSNSFLPITGTTQYSVHTQGSCIAPLLQPGVLIPTRCISIAQTQKINAAISPFPKPWSQLCKAEASFSALLSLTDASEPGAAVKVTRFSNSL